MKYFFIALLLFGCEQFKCNTFPVGSLVELKSGSPKMTILACNVEQSEVSDVTETVTVEWIDTLGHPQAQRYFVYELKASK